MLFHPAKVLLKVCTINFIQSSMGILWSDISTTNIYYLLNHNSQRYHNWNYKSGSNSRRLVDTKRSKLWSRRIMEWWLWCISLSIRVLCTGKMIIHCWCYFLLSSPYLYEDIIIKCGFTLIVKQNHVSSSNQYIFINCGLSLTL